LCEETKKSRRDEITEEAEVMCGCIEVKKISIEAKELRQNPATGM
jgi:hypothetical protein